MLRKCGGFSAGAIVRSSRWNIFRWLPALCIFALGPMKHSLGIMPNPTRAGFAEFEHGHFKKAAGSLRIGADKGDALAMCGLADLYLLGRGVPRDPRKAFSYWRKAAGEGDGSAMLRLGQCYLEAHGVPKNLARGYRWCRRSAATCDVEAMEQLGFLYRKGIGVQRNYGKALEWFRQAAGRGNTSAMIGIGGMYLDGYGALRSRSAWADQWRVQGRVTDRRKMDRVETVYGRRALRVSWWHRSCVARGKGTSDVAKKSKTLGRAVLSSTLNPQGATHAGYGITVVLLGNCMVYRPHRSIHVLLCIRLISHLARLSAVKQGWLFQVFFPVFNHKLPCKQIWPVTNYLWDADHFSAAYSKKN